jgi:hypothetical protein
MYKTIAPGILVLIALACRSPRVAHAADAATEKADVAVAAVPVYRIEEGSRLTIEVRYENLSNFPITYIRGIPSTREPQGSDYYLHFLLRKDGKSILLGTQYYPPALGASDVRKLQPGEHLTYLLDIPLRSRRLPPGTYELRAQHSLRPNSTLVNEFGLTRVPLNRTIAYVVVEKKEPVERKSTPSASEPGP